MRGISLRQPWATLVATGAKGFETRSRGTSYRGPVAIYASRRFPRDCQRLCDRWPFDLALGEAGYWCRYSGEDESGFPRRESWSVVLPLGVIVAVAELDWVRRIDDRAIRRVAEVDRYGRERAFSDWRDGRWYWRFVSVRRLPRPVPCRGQSRGQIGPWPIAPETLAAIEAQLAPRPAPVGEAHDRAWATNLAQAT